MRVQAQPFPGDQFKVAQLKNYSSRPAHQAEEALANPYRAEAAETVETLTQSFVDRLARYDYPTEEANDPTLAILHSRTDTRAAQEKRSAFISGAASVGLFAVGFAAGYALPAGPLTMALQIVGVGGGTLAVGKTTAHALDSFDASRLGGEVERWGAAMSQADPAQLEAKEAVG